MNRPFSRSVALSSLALLLTACPPPQKVDTSSTPEDTASFTVDTSVVDSDGDGISVGDGDCDDTNAEVFPGQSESCNGIDDNCNDSIDEGFGDADGDGAADCVDSEECDGIDNDGDGEIDEGFDTDSDGDGTPDCVDTEECDGLDNDGDGDIDEGFDADGDGYSSCDDVEDCDDGDDTVYPDAPELDGDLVDNDCDGLIDEGAWEAGDLVITEVMSNPGMVSDPVGEWFEILNASGRLVYLNGLEIWSAVDDESYVITSDELLFLEADEYVVIGAVMDTSLNGGIAVDHAWSGMSLSNQADAIALYAGDLLIDEMSWDDGLTMPDPDGASLSLDPDHLTAVFNDDPTFWCEASQPFGDVNGDFGSPGQENDYAPCIDQDGDGYATTDGDCDETDPDIYPGADEIPYDGIDNDCDSSTVDDDLDNDGYDSIFTGGQDCDDQDDEINPDADEICDDDGVDEDCDGDANDADLSVIDASYWYLDLDEDGYGGNDSETLSCGDTLLGYTDEAGDCNDADDGVYPGATEIWYDGEDQNCDGLSDYDADQDGFDHEDYDGDDCDDEDSSTHPYAYEDTSDGADNDCDGAADSLDPDTMTRLSTSDDSSSLISFSSVTIPFCGSDWTAAYVNSNGTVHFGSSYSSYTESSSTLQSMNMIAGWWDDLYPVGSYGSVEWAEYDDAVGVYWVGVPELGYTTTDNDFAIIMFDDGRIMLSYDDMYASDGLVGWSCSGASEDESDLTETVMNDDALGLGSGTEEAMYEQFTGSTGDIRDIENRSFVFCAQIGDDNDGDGFTDECGDPDDSDDTVTP